MKKLNLRFKCPEKLPAGSPKRKTGVARACWRIEKVDRKDRDGYITVFYSMSTGKPIGYGKGYITPGGSIQEVCGAAPDRAKASIKARGSAVLDGELCVQFAESRIKPKTRGG